MDIFLLLSAKPQSSESNLLKGRSLAYYSSLASPLIQIHVLEVLMSGKTYSSVFHLKVYRTAGMGTLKPHKDDLYASYNAFHVGFT